MSIKIADLSAVAVAVDACEGQRSSSLTREQMTDIRGGVAMSDGSYPVTMVIPPLVEGAQPTYINGIPSAVANNLPSSSLYYFIALQ